MSKKYNLENLKKNIFRESKNIEFEIINFDISTQYELDTLKNKKAKNNKTVKYTAVFFCRKKTDWFLYKVIYNIDDKTLLDDMKGLKKKLEVGARTMFALKKNTKNPISYLKDIKLSDDET